MILGYIETIEPKSVRGWVYDQANPARRLHVELTVDGRTVAVAPVSETRPDLAALNIGRTDVAYDLRVPAGVVPDVARMSVRVGGTRDSLRLSSNACRVEGSLERISGAIAAGWACRLGYPEERLVLEVQVDGKLVGEGRADQPRTDLLQHGIGDGYYGFLIETRVPIDGLPPERIKIIDRRSGEALADRRAQMPAATAPLAMPRAQATAPRVAIEEDQPASITLSREAAEALRQAMGLHDDEGSVF